LIFEKKKVVKQNNNIKTGLQEETVAQPWKHPVKTKLLQVLATLHNTKTI